MLVLKDFTINNCLVSHFYYFLTNVKFVLRYFPLTDSRSNPESSAPEQGSTHVLRGLKTKTVAR